MNRGVARDGIPEWLWGSRIFFHHTHASLSRSHILPSLARPQHQSIPRMLTALMWQRTFSPGIVEFAETQSRPQPSNARWLGDAEGRHGLDVRARCQLQQPTWCRMTPATGVPGDDDLGTYTQYKGPGYGMYAQQVTRRPSSNCRAVTKPIVAIRSRTPI